MGDGVARSVDGGVARLTIDRPEAGNAIAADQRDQLIRWLEEASADAEVRCVVLGATGRFFCTGADLRSPSGAPAADRLVGDVRRSILRGAVRLIGAVLDCEKPVVAAVQGTAAGIGAHLAFACDLVVAAEEAKFIEVFARRGLAADGLGTWLLPRLIGLGRAKELILLADDVPAARARELGLVSRVVPAASLDAEVDALARRLSEGPTKAYGASKWLLNRSFDVPRSTLADEEAWVVEAMSGTEDSVEGLAAYAERREPHYRGR